MTSPVFSLQEQVKRYRAQMLIHSYLYYHRFTNIISDYEFDRRGLVLVALQAKLEKELGHTSIGFYDEHFLDWTADTGYHLPHDNWVVSKAIQIVRIHEEKYNE